MHEDVRFRVNAPAVVSERIDGEVVGINLDTGFYYGFPGTATEVWCLMEEGRPAAEIVAVMAARYDASESRIATAVRAFLLQLVKEGLVVADEKPATVPVAATAPVAQAGEARPPFEVPVLEKHTDMQEFLLVDPIHEVDVTDWPHARPRNDD